MPTMFRAQVREHIQKPFRQTGRCSKDHAQFIREAKMNRDDVNKVAEWMVQHGYATGHGDTMEDLLVELDMQIVENWTRALVKGVQGEREACAKVLDEMAAKDKLSNYYQVAAIAIRARGAGMTDDIGERFAHRLAVMLECALLDPVGTWNDGHALLDEYRQALRERDDALGIPYVSGFGKD
jgi:hypothetical protein